MSRCWTTTRVLALIAVLAGVAGVARAQSFRDDLVRRGLDPDPLTVEPLGLVMHPPIQAIVQVQRVGERVTMTIVDGETAPAWSMSVQRRTSTLHDPSPGAQVDHLLGTLRTGQTSFDIIRNEPVTYGGQAAQLCILRRSTPSGEPIINGWLIVDADEKDFLVFAIQILTERELERVSSLLEDSFSTMAVTPLRYIAGERKLRLDAGRSFLGTLTPDRLRSLIGPTRWYRYYTPAESGGPTSDTELGYYALTFTEGMLGAIDPDRRESSYDPSERQMGFMVIVQGHYIDVAQNMTYDSDGRYWLAWDRSEEAWSILGTRRQGKRSESEAVTGIRKPRTAAQPTGLITVVISGRDGSDRDQKSWAVPDVYLSQATRWALGELLPRNPGGMLLSTYCIDSASMDTRVSLRIDRWEPTTPGSVNWRLTSQARSDAPKIESIHGRDGRLLRRTWPDGRVTEPIKLDDLHALWTRKGLPTGKMR